MTDLFFVDTNVLVYSKDLNEPTKMRRSNDWIDALWTAQVGRVSAQVLSEFYDVTARKDVSKAERKATVLAFATWKPQPIDVAIIEGAWEIQDRFQLSWWNALIVAAAQRQGCRYLLTEDTLAGQDLGGVMVVNPFTTAPESLITA